MKEQEEEEDCEVSPEKVVDGEVEDGDGGDDGGEDKLSCDYAVDLANETPLKLAVSIHLLDQVYICIKTPYFYQSAKLSEIIYTKACCMCMCK